MVIGCDDGEFDCIGVSDFVFVWLGYGIWVESGDLVVVGVGGDEVLCGEGGFDLVYVLGWDV